MAFDPFGDHATLGYLRNVAAGEPDPERVKRLEHRSFSANVLTALEALQSVPQLRYEHILQTHKTLFGAVYPWAGQDRGLALTEELRKPGGPLDRLLAPHIVQGPMKLQDTAARLSANPGLNPTSRPSGPSPSPGF